MQDLTSYIKENDTDKKELGKLKELATKLTGISEVEGKTISDVLEFINNNYVGGGGSSENVSYYLVGDTFTEGVECVNEGEHVVVKEITGGYTDVSTTLLTPNNTFKIGSIKYAVDGEVVMVSGVLPCIYHTGTYNFKVGAIWVHEGEAELILSDNSILTDTAQTIFVYVTNGVLQFVENED